MQNSGIKPVILVNFLAGVSIQTHHFRKHRSQGCAGHLRNLDIDGLLVMQQDARRPLTSQLTPRFWYLHIAPRLKSMTARSSIGPSERGRIASRQKSSEADRPWLLTELTGSSIGTRPFDGRPSQSRPSIHHPGQNTQRDIGLGVCGIAQVQSAFRSQ